MRLRTSVLVAVLALGIYLADGGVPIPAEPISVEQLQRKLEAPIGPRASDSQVPAALLQDATLAIEIQNLQLSERLTSATLARFLAEHAFGPQTRQALNLLADRSALLDPPANELPSRAAPDAETQQKMLDAARVFVFQTLSRLPNFFATRTTSQFYGIPPEFQAGSPGVDPGGTWIVHAGLHPRGTSSREITFRDGKELLDPMKPPRPPTLPQRGLETWGEFGPELAVVLMDVATGTAAFHHWEQLPAGLAAVFRYSVGEEDSQYEVNYSCNASNTFHAEPAYHGSLAVDPVSGAILRITLEADWKPKDPISHVASVIEYGPVEIGGRRYICPLRSLAFSVEEASLCARKGVKQRLVHPMTLNRTTFSDYHRLGSTARIVTDMPTPKEPKR